MLEIFKFIPPYLLFTCLSFLISSIVLLAFMYREKMVNKNLPKYIINIPISIYVGALLFSVLSLIIDDVVNNGCKRILRIITDGKYGLVYYGGLTGLVITTYTFVKRNLISSKIYDILSFVIPIFHSVSRIGCYFAGCCYGIKNNDLFQLPQYKDGIFTGGYCVPTQIIESVFEMLLAVLFVAMYLKKLKGFNLLKLYLIFYALFRFFIEFFRDDKMRGVYLGISFSQYFSILIVVLLLFQKYTKNHCLRRNHK